VPPAFDNEQYLKDLREMNRSLRSRMMGGVGAGG
jgi:hypothetical protein